MKARKKNWKEGGKKIHNKTGAEESVRDEPQRTDGESVCERVVTKDRVGEEAQI